MEINHEQINIGCLTLLPIQDVLLVLINFLGGLTVLKNGVSRLTDQVDQTKLVLIRR